MSLSNKQLIDELQARLGSEATELDATRFAEYLYQANWLPNDLDALRAIPQHIWDDGLQKISAGESQ